MAMDYHGFLSFSIVWYLLLLHHATYFDGFGASGHLGIYMYPPIRLRGADQSLKVELLFGDEVQVAPNPTGEQASASSLVWVSEAMLYQVLL